MADERPPRARPPIKADGAFRTIGEVSVELGVPQHVLRYWEGRFPQLKPLQRAGNRRYYRPDDVLLLRQIQRLLDHDGYSMRGVQKLLADKPDMEPTPVPAVIPVPDEAPDLAAALRAVRSLLRDALRDDVAR